MVRLTQKMITAAYAPEFNERWIQLLEGQYVGSSVRDMLDFLSVGSAQKEFWIQRASDLRRGVTAQYTPMPFYDPDIGDYID
jgi:hypothetical protein